MDASELVERIYDHVESGDVDKAVMVCLRLARKIGDTSNTIIFLHELDLDTELLQKEIYDEVQGLKLEVQDYIWKTRLDQWLKERTLPYSIDPNNPDFNVLVTGVSDLQHEIERMEKSVDEIKRIEKPHNDFVDNFSNVKGQMQHKIIACRTVLERIRARCLNYATRIEKQIEVANSTSNFMASLENDVLNYYAERCEPVYLKLSKAASLIGSKEAEDHALLLTSIRRAVNAVANYHFPPSSESVVCNDGNTRVLGEEQYLNRLHEFCCRLAPSDTSGKLLRAELEYLSVFVRRLNDIASKGVHSEVTIQEAKQGLLGLHMFLSNLIAKMEQKPATSGETSELV